MTEVSRVMYYTQSITNQNKKTVYGINLNIIVKYMLIHYVRHSWILKVQLGPIRMLSSINCNVIVRFNSLYMYFCLYVYLMKPDILSYIIIRFF